MKKILLFLVIPVFSLAADNSSVYSVHCPLGCPHNPAGNSLVFGHLYALSNNPKTKFADWVAYEVNVVNFGDSPGRKWQAEKLLPESETLEPDDYSKASKAIGVDRGHQAPLASFAGSRYWSELNHLANITPQSKDLNQGPWQRLEQAVRDASRFRDSLFVITGPIYGQNTSKLPRADEPHEIPFAYFKIVYDKKGRAAAFIMSQNTARNADLCPR